MSTSLDQNEQDGRDKQNQRQEGLRYTKQKMWEPRKDSMDIIRLESWPVLRDLPVELLIRLSSVAIKSYLTSTQVAVSSNHRLNTVVHVLLHTMDAHTYLMGDSKKLGLGLDTVTDPHELSVLQGVHLGGACFAPSLKDPFLVVLTDEGHVWCSETSTGELQRVTEMPPAVTKIACRSSAVLALASGDVYEKFRSQTRQDVQQVYGKSSEGDDAVAITCGEHHSAILTLKGRLLIWGSDKDRQMGRGTIEKYHERPTPILPDTFITAVTCGSYNTSVVTLEGKVLCWGTNDAGDLVPVRSPENLSNTRVVAIKSVCDTTVAVVEHGETFEWARYRKQSSDMHFIDTRERRDFPTDLLVDCGATGGLVSIDPASICFIVWKEPKLISIKDEIIAALTKDIETDGNPRKKKVKRSVSKIEIDRRKKKFKQTRKYNDDLNDHIEKILEENGKLQNENKSLLLRVQSEENATRINQLEQLLAERDSEMKNVKEANTENSTRIKELEQLLAERDSEMKNVEEANTELSLLRQKHDALKMYARLSNQDDSSLEDNMDANETLQKVLKQKETLERVIDSLKNELSQKADSLNFATQERAKLEKSLNEAKSQFEVKSEAYEGAVREIIFLKERLDSVIKEFEVKSEAYEGAVREIIFLKERLDSVIKEFEVKSESYEGAVREIIFLRERLDSVIKEMLAKIEGSQAQILENLRAQMEDSNNAMHDQIRQLRHSNESMLMYMNVTKKGLISFEVLHHVAQNITTNWNYLGISLGLDMSTLEFIRHDFPSLRNKAFHMLMAWYERDPKAATKEKLVKALNDLGRADIGDAISDMK